MVVGGMWERSETRARRMVQSRLRVGVRGGKGEGRRDGKRVGRGIGIRGEE